MSKIQFNSKDAKSFRTMCEKYYNAQHALKDLVNKKSDTIRAYQTILDGNQSDLDAIADGTYAGHRTADAIIADSDTIREKMATAKTDYDNAKAEQDKRIETALVLYTDTMHTAATNVVANFGDTDAISAWRTALAESFVANGITDATADNVSQFDFLISAKSNSAKQVYKSNSLLGIAGKKQATILFLNGLTEYLVSVGVLKPFAHKYIPVSERNKNK